MTLPIYKSIIIKIFFGLCRISNTNMNDVCTGDGAHRLTTYLCNDYGLFTLPDSETNSNSNSKCKPNGYMYHVELFRMHRVRFRFQSKLSTTGIGIRIGIRSVNNYKPLQ